MNRQNCWVKYEIKLNLDQSEFFIKQREQTAKYIHLTRHYFNYRSYLRHATHIVSVPAGACVCVFALSHTPNGSCVSYHIIAPLCRDP